jgi:hypothetical protein
MGKVLATVTCEGRKWVSDLHTNSEGCILMDYYPSGARVKSVSLSEAAEHTGRTPQKIYQSFKKDWEESALYDQELADHYASKISTLKKQLEACSAQ